MSILIPASGVTAAVDETAAFGVRDLETGGFLLVPRSSSADGGSPVAVIALVGDTGIVRDAACSRSVSARSTGSSPSPMTTTSGYRRSFTRTRSARSCRGPTSGTDCASRSSSQP